MLIPDISRLRRGRRGVTDNWNVLSEAAKKIKVLFLVSRPLRTYPPPPIAWKNLRKRYIGMAEFFVVPVIVIIN